MSTLADTSVVLRLMLADDGEQYPRAVALAKHAESAGDPLVITEPVFAEAYWVLTRTMGLPVEEVLDSLADLGSTAGVCFESPVVEAAIEILRGRRRLDAVDALLIARAGMRGDRVASFDSAVNAECGERAAF